MRDPPCKLRIKETNYLELQKLFGRTYFMKALVLKEKEKTRFKFHTFFGYLNLE